MIKPRNQAQSIVQSYFVKLKTPNSTDNTLYWSYQVPIIKPNEKKLVIMAQKQYLSLLNISRQDLPKIISVIIDSVNFSIDNTGSKSNKIFNFYLVNQVQLQGNKVDAFYESNQTTVDIGCLRVLNMRINVDQDEIMSGQLQNQIYLEFMIKHQ